MPRLKGSIDRTPRKRRSDAGKPKSTPIERDAAEPQSNIVNSKLLRETIDAWEREQKAIESIQEDCKEECAPYRESQKMILERATDRGIPKRALRAKLRQRTIERKLELDDRELLQSITEALGAYASTPLGQAAVKAGASELTEAFGKPVPLTEEERDQGQTAAFVDEHGNRTSIGIKEELKAAE